MLIVVTGIDGSGKSTVTNLLLESLRESGALTRRRDKWDVYDRALHPSCKFLHGPLAELRSCISSMPVPSRTLFLFWTMHLTMRQELLANVDYCILDSFWYKHAASEIIYGSPPELVEALSRPLPEPDDVFFLDVDPQEAWRRKQAMNFEDIVPYECGMAETPDAASFIAHQTRLRKQMMAWARQHRWRVLDGSLSPREIVELIVSEVHVAHSS